MPFTPTYIKPADIQIGDTIVWAPKQCKNCHNTYGLVSYLTVSFIEEHETNQGEPRLKLSGIGYCTYINGALKDLLFPLDWPILLLVNRETD